MKVIALSGWKQSGKDTAVNYICKNYDGLRLSFADPLKDNVSFKFNVPRNHLDYPEFKEKPILTLPVDPKDKFSSTIADFMFKEFRTEKGEIPSIPAGFYGIKKEYSDFYFNKLYWTPRALAILEGSTCRSVDSSYWVKQVTNKIFLLMFSSVSPSPNYVVISDLRYKSELQQLKQSFGDNLVTIRINRFDSLPSQDPSEIDLDDAIFDYTIENKGTLDEFYKKIDWVVKKIKAQSCL